MTDFEHQTISANGTEHHVVTAGDGPPMIMIHGFPQTWYEWRHVMEAFAPSYRVIAPDMRGMGDSAPCTTGQDKRNLAKDAREILRAMGIDRAIIVGHDWGGGVTERFVLDYPEASRALINIDMFYMPLFPVSAILSVEQLHHSWYMFMHQDPKLPEQIAAQAGFDFVNWFFEHGSGDAGSPFSEAEVSGYASRFTGDRATAHFNCYRNMFTVDPPHWAEDADRKLDLPTLWIQGDKDPFVNAEWVKLLPQAFNDLRVEIFEGCGHWVPEEQPERLISTMKDFLRSIENRE
jgi:pimeloyl-ACP methyl ester carboxylesterase